MKQTLMVAITLLALSCDTSNENKHLQTINEIYPTINKIQSKESEQKL